MTIAILGATGRMGSATASLFKRELAKRGLDEAILGTHRTKPLALDGITGIELDANDDASIATVCAQADTVIDCLGPSARYGERISRICNDNGTRLISLGHVHHEGARGQVLEAGALPGLLAGAFELADAKEARDIEVIYEFNGSLTPTAAHDILATDYREGLAATAGPRSTCVDAEKAIPYHDVVTAKLAERAHATVHAFSIWPEALLEAFRSPTSMEMDRRAMAMSAASTLQRTHDTVIRITTNPGSASEETTTIHIPSLYDFSAAGAWLAWREGYMGSNDPSAPFALLAQSDLPRILTEALELSGGWMSQNEEDDAEEGEL